MPPKKRSKKGELTADEQPNSSSTGRKRKRGTPTQQTENVMPSALPTIDYTLLAKHILTEQQKLTSSENGLAEATVSQHGEASTSVIQNKEPQSSSELVNPAATTSVTDGTPQASAMVPASALGALLDNVFTGEPAGSNSDTNPQIQLTDCVPLGATVSSKLKLKIWNNEFVDLKLLLPNSNEEPLSIMVKAGKIELQQTSSNKNPITIHQWTDAFLIFSTIYLQKFPQEASNLLKYMFTIRDISKLHGEQAWRTYDESFRKIRETSLLPWEKVVTELRLKAASVGIRSPNKLQGSSGKRQPFRPKYCFAYNKGQKCNSHPCRFSHTCQDCHGPHPRVQCTGIRSNSSSSIRNGSSPSNSSKPSTTQK
ncbi:uncharacterized protein LOC133195612 [Saccostrea echinata]|uniref:uncharacterized protein LOC133195612 n=1 Tax=Saccostrea echinata TaxID=191078 RepID=UPI002A7F2059|nr:uncharacterized protein LOC133195612 [Saccostrea echinata]